MRIAHKLWLPTIGLTIAVAAVATVDIVSQRSGAERAEAKLNAQQHAVTDAVTWRAMSEANATRARVLLLSGEAHVQADLKSQMEATSRQIGELQKRIEGRAADADEQGALQRVASARKDYLAARDEVQKLKAAGQTDDAKAGWESRVQPLLSAYLAAQQSFVELEDKRGAALRADIAGDQSRMQWILNVALGLAVAVAALSSLLVSRSLRRQLDHLAGTARQIGEGHLALAIDTSPRDEVGDVLRALAQMRDALHGIVGQVRQAAESIQIASAEVASGNADLSHRTEQTASSLQDTASSVVQLTGTVGQSADAAAQANQLAVSASSVAVKGGEVVAQVVTTMSEIDTASKRIADIIGTIDGIAFQTNILALNAAVEAARAGEQGRGFAVVAAEVRSLAQRSAEAAREIKSLIGASVDRVENGTRLVHTAGATMNEIVDSVRRVSDVIGEISAATGEQRGSIGEVNRAVSELDQMTQQNAALVEQSAAAAESLREQARKLSESMRVFRLGDNAALPAPDAVASSPAPLELAPALPSAPAPAASVAPVARAAAAAAKPAPASHPAAARPPAPKVAAPALAEAVATASADEWETF